MYVFVLKHVLYFENTCKKPVKHYELKGKVIHRTKAPDYSCHIYFETPSCTVVRKNTNIWRIDRSSNKLVQIVVSQIPHLNRSDTRLCNVLKYF